MGGGSVPHLAVTESRSRGILLTLLQAGADPCKEDSRGRAPGQLAAELGNQPAAELLNMLAERGFDSLQRNRSSERCTPAPRRQQSAKRWMPSRTA